MKSKKSFLVCLATLGKPLVDFSIHLQPGQSCNEVMHLMNELADDLEISPSHYNEPDDPENHSLWGTATREALAREFGWILQRVKFRAGNLEPNQNEGTFENYFLWEEIAPVQYYPESIRGKIESIGMDQPGSDDDGQDDVITYGDSA
ncbi:hypothetical protein [Gimesia maris]|uniref:hypothetical protein n=1 Tax=Gimesia maris TaxID=122 RepID=UPI00241F63AD|nr:hypothetical protein [Gimesia maris]|tara:strand:+ start:189832 stop:190275 length:444 start_codon:yes stop_codon:yes gene_type:complete